MRDSEQETQENPLVELVIEDLAFDGKSVAHLDGKVVFLKGGLPGERVRAEIYKSKARYSQGIVREVLEKSLLRVDAPCEHFDVCGGCTWQDLDYASQLKFKQKQVGDCLERLGDLPDVPVRHIIGAVELFRYRNKMEFSFHVTPDGGFTLGLHRRGRFDDIFQLDQCFLQSDISNRVVSFVRDYVRREGLEVYDVRGHTGYMRFLVIRQAKRTSDLMVNLVTNYGAFPNREKLIKELRQAVPEVSTIVHNENGQKSNIAVGEKEEILFGSGYIEERLFDSRFHIRANSFFQTNTIQTEALYRAAFEVLEPEPSHRALDLYCGTGSIGILLAPYVQEVIGVELVPDAVKMAHENMAVNNVTNISFYEGHVRDFLRTETATEKPFDIVIVDPPRAGLHPKALRRALELRPDKLLYISCNPSTFARDAKAIVAAGYHLPFVQPVDMFPHTMHIELIAPFALK